MNRGLWKCKKDGDDPTQRLLPADRHLSNRPPLKPPSQLHCFGLSTAPPPRGPPAASPNLHFPLCNGCLPFKRKSIHSVQLCTHAERQRSLAFQAGPRFLQAAFLRPGSEASAPARQLRKSRRKRPNRGRPLRKPPASPPAALARGRSPGLGQPSAAQPASLAFVKRPRAPLDWGWGRAQACPPAQSWAALGCLAQTAPARPTPSQGGCGGTEWGAPPQKWLQESQAFLCQAAAKGRGKLPRPGGGGAFQLHNPHTSTALISPTPLRNSASQRTCLWYSLSRKGRSRLLPWGVCPTSGLRRGGGGRRQVGFPK